MGEESIGWTKIRWRSYQYAYGKKDNIERSPVSRVKGSRGWCTCRFYDVRCWLLYVEYVGDICSEANTTRKHRYDCVVMVLIDVSMVLRHCVKQKIDYVGYCIVGFRVTFWFVVWSCVDMWLDADREQCVSCASMQTDNEVHWCK